MNAASVEELEINPLELTDEMRRFATERVGRNKTRLQRLLELQAAIFDPEDGLGITYGSSLTRTAAETFAQRDGNCLSFTLLFSALARYLGLDAYFVEVDEVMGWSQRGELDLNHWHMYVEVELDGNLAQIDFLPWAETRYRKTRRVSEDRVNAHYLNNLGVDSLTSGQVGDALEKFEDALRFDPGFEPARINMAVALRRVERFDEAEAALLETLDSEKRNVVAASNLASLYLAMGRSRDARKWLQRRDTSLDRNPFHHFRLGMKALSADDPGAARGHLRRAIRRQSDEALFHERLAEAHGQLGAVRKARRSLLRAARLTTDPDRRQQLEARLAQLTASGASNS